MPVSRRTAVLTGTFAALGLAAGPARAASPRTASARGTEGRTGPDAEALAAALTGLPDADATAALVRVGGTDGSWHGSAGVHDLTTRRAADPHALFRAGSVTKVVTAATVLHLAAERRVQLDAPARHHLPDLLGHRYRHVTVRQLLNHTSGIPVGEGLGDTFEEVYAHRFDTLPPRQVAASAAARNPEFAPGTAQHYLNINYTFLGLLIEAVTGGSYAEEATRRILRPAGMRHTYFPGADPRIRGPHNHGYQAVTRADGSTELLDVTDWNQADRFAAGDMISTTADLERLLGALFRGRLLPPRQLREMFTVPPHIDGATYSAGLQRFVHEDRVYWLKSGSRYGYSAVIAATRDLTRTLTYSVNATDAKGEDMNPTAQRIALAALA